MERSVGFGEIISECTAVVREQASFLVVAVLGIGAAYTLADMVAEALANVVSLVAGIFVACEFYLRALDARDRGGKNYISLFGVSILTTLGMIAGAILLILPAFYLAARWSLAPTAVVADNLGTTDAMGKSWRATASAAWPLFGVVLSAGVLVILLFLLLGGTGAILGFGETDILFSAPLNLLAAAVSAGGWVFSVATYRLLSDREDELHDVFG